MLWVLRRYFSAVVYLRNSLRAYQTAKPFLEKKVLTRSVALSAIFSAVVPSVINAEINSALDKMIKGDALMVRAEIQSLKYVVPLINFDVLALHYHRSPPNERETEKMKAIAAIYKEMTNKDLERKTRMLMD